ncbi:MAG TPA: hypothetical protein PKI46_01945 [Bacteroidales bacterium]|jgi:hypothetical protein|nr:hypothetical protein [Bacteroidales bacterium]
MVNVIINRIILDKEVFCQDCGWYYNDGYVEKCVAPLNKFRRVTYFNAFYTSKLPEELNKENNCPFYSIRENEDV